MMLYEYNIKVLTTVLTSPALQIRDDFTAWKMSTVPSMFKRSKAQQIAIKVPVREHPSL